MGVELLNEQGRPEGRPVSWNDVGLHGTAAGVVVWSARSRGHYGDGVGELEAQHGLRGDLNLLAFGDGVDAETCTAAGCCADGCTLTATEDTAEDRSCCCAYACLGCGVGAAAFAFLALFMYGASMLLFFAALVHLDVTTASISLYLVPVFGVILAISVLGEKLSLPEVIGAAIVLVATLLIVRYDHAT
jgi:multidrug transporter EmrE-like cation transporter